MQSSHDISMPLTSGQNTTVMVAVDDPYRTRTSNCPTDSNCVDLSA